MQLQRHESASVLVSIASTVILIQHIISATTCDTGKV